MARPRLFYLACPLRWPRTSQGQRSSDSGGDERPGRLVTEMMRGGKMSWFNGREMSSLWVGGFPATQHAAARTGCEAA
jgi:hypothetical protein